MSMTFKRHYNLFVLLALVATALILGVGQQPIVAYSMQSSGQAVAQGADQSSPVALFSSTVVHSIQVLMSDLH